MRRIGALLTVLCASVSGATYQRYGESAGPYYTTPTYYPKREYGNEQYPREGVYSNNNPGASTYNAYGYSTPRYGEAYGGGAGGGASYGSGYAAGGGGGNYNNQYRGQYNTASYGNGYSSYEMPFMRSTGEYCVSRAPQGGVWVDSMMGMWYGVEFIEHLAGDSRVDYSRTCIVLHISEPADQPSSEPPAYHVQHIKAKFDQEHRHLRLLWNENGLATEYSLYFRNDSAGYWHSMDVQNGSMTRKADYHQFTGTVQVLKAVHDHMVLNFCQEPASGRPSQLYSVLFSRAPASMAPWELESVHTLLQNKRLSVASRRMVCGNSGAAGALGAALALLAAAVALACAS